MIVLFKNIIEKVLCGPVEQKEGKILQRGSNNGNYFLNHFSLTDKLLPCYLLWGQRCNAAYLTGLVLIVSKYVARL